MSYDNQKNSKTDKYAGDVRKMSKPSNKRIDSFDDTMQKKRKPPMKKVHRAARTRKTVTAITGSGVLGLVGIMALTDHSVVSQATAKHVVSKTSVESSIQTTVGGTISPVHPVVSSTTSSMNDSYVQSMAQSSQNVYVQPQVQTRGSG